MARYFFHLRTATGLIVVDDEGLEFTTLEAAHAEVPSHTLRHRTACPGDPIFLRRDLNNWVTRIARKMRARVMTGLSGNIASRKNQSPVRPSSMTSRLSIAMPAATVRA
jgi:hypothetical protein